MSDISVETPVAGSGTSETPVATTQTPETTVTATETDTAADTGTVEDDSRFGEHAAYIKELRSEAAKHRTANKPYADAFSAYSDEERAVWMELATGLVNDPAATAERMQGIVDSIRGVGGDADTLDNPDTPATDDDTPLTKKQMQEFLAERDKAADLDKRVANIKSSAEKLGYKEGSVDYRMLLLTAQEAGGDLDKAHATMQATRQSHIDAYLAAKKADAGATAPGDPAAPSQTMDVNTWEGARAALLERLRAKQAQ